MILRRRASLLILDRPPSSIDRDGVSSLLPVLVLTARLRPGDASRAVSAICLPTGGGSPQGPECCATATERAVPLKTNPKIHKKQALGLEPNLAKTELPKRPSRAAITGQGWVIGSLFKYAFSDIKKNWQASCLAGLCHKWALAVSSRGCAL